MYLIILLMSFTATSTGMLTGSLVSDPKKLGLVINLITIPLLSFCGFFKNINSLPVWVGWIRFLSPFNYAFTALVGNETLYKSSLIG
jgi:ABC-type multidrug transport system permease subunit